MPRVLAYCAVLLRQCGRRQRAPVRILVDVVESSLIEIVNLFVVFSHDRAVAREVFAEPSAATVAEAVCVVGWRAVGDSFGGSGVDVAKCMCDALELVGAESHLVGEDEVVS